MAHMMKHKWTTEEISGRVKRTREEIKGKKGTTEYKITVERVRAYCMQVEFLLN